MSKHTITQGLHIEKLTFLRHGLEKTVTNDMALDFQISQGVKTRFEPKLGKSCTLSLPVDLEKALSELEKIGVILRQLIE